MPARERIATFDNDGTLWAEQPVYFQLQFAFDRVKALVPQHPEWKEKEPFNHLLAGGGQVGLTYVPLSLVLNFHGFYEYEAKSRTQGAAFGINLVFKF